MNKIALTSAILFLGGALAFAGPEPLPYSGKEMKQAIAPAPPECDFTWTGFYIGGNGGGGWADGHTRYSPLPSAATFFSFALLETSLDADMSGGFWGGQLGYNQQFGHFVLGVETDFEGSDISGHKLHDPVPAIPPFDPGETFLRTSEDINWFGTFRGRVGYAPFCRFLIYGTGGLAYGDVDYSAVVNFANAGGPVIPASRSETNLGWTGGGGLEFAISRHWTIKAEYLYVDLGDESTTVLAPLGFGNRGGEAVHFHWATVAHTVKGGFNFKF